MDERLMARATSERPTTSPRLWAAGLVMATALGLAGCGSTVTGMAVKATNQPQGDEVAVALLDTGNYPTKVVPVSLTPGATTGVILEGQRMAGTVVVPSEVDGSLRQLSALNTGPAENAQALRADIELRRANVAAAHRFVAGFSTSRTTEGESAPNTSLVHLVMRFPDPGTAAAASAEMAATDPLQRPTPIPRHPDAAASAFDMPHGVFVESFTPHGPYVLYQWLHTDKTLETATELIAKTLDLQGPRIDRFVPTDPSQLASLPVDPTGLLAHTLPSSPYMATRAIGVYSAQAALHFESDPVKSAALFTAAGVESMALNHTMVYQARDSAGAAYLVDQLAANEASAGARPAEGVAGLPNAKCLDQGADVQRGQLRFDCYAHAGRYAFKASSLEAQDAREQAAAQYLMLSG
jgi:hypothetical protein